ncbi:hypothetical protein R1sor_018676 [Riccia sorocarpa]|uniref:Uncharacterized protein n=1 Tax=Riccia sorocarpa TaxID=122646 RepID=A0ABD3IGK8_9MARC
MDRFYYGLSKAVPSGPAPKSPVRREPVGYLTAADSSPESGGYFPQRKREIQQRNGQNVLKDRSKVEVGQKRRNGQKGKGERKGREKGGKLHFYETQATEVTGGSALRQREEGGNDRANLEGAAGSSTDWQARSQRTKTSEESSKEARGDRKNSRTGGACCAYRAVATRVSIKKVTVLVDGKCG